MLQKGMAAWMEQLSLVPMLVEKDSPDRGDAEQRLSDERCNELIDLLTNFAMARLTEAAL